MYKKIMCPEAIGTVLWTYALKTVTERLNRVKITPEKKTTDDCFIVTMGIIRPKAFHTWGRPVYLFKSPLQ